MKNTILILAITLFIAGTISVSCQSSNEKANHAKEDIVQATEEFNQAIKDSIAQFKMKSEEIIVANEKKIEELKTKIANEKKDNKAIYEERLAELEQKNVDLRKKLVDFKDDKIDNWESFKNEFNSDLNNLGAAFTNFFEKDK